MNYIGFGFSVNRRSFKSMQSSWQAKLLLRGGKGEISRTISPNASYETISDVYQFRQLTPAENLLLFPTFPAMFQNGEQICGLGLGVSSIYPHWSVCFITPDSAAARCGKIRVGDRLVAINGRILDGLNEDQVRALAVGRAGSRVTLQIAPDKSDVDDERQLHPASDTLTVELEREPSFLPQWAQEDPERPIPREEGPAKWRYVAEQTDIWNSMGYNLSDFGCWEARTDAQTRRVFYVDALTNRTRWDKPGPVASWEQMEKLTLTQLTEETYRRAARFLNRYSLLPRNDSEPHERLPSLDGETSESAEALHGPAQPPSAHLPTTSPARAPPADAVGLAGRGEEEDSGDGLDREAMAREVRAALRADCRDMGVDLEAAEPELLGLRDELAALYGGPLRGDGDGGLTPEEWRAQLTAPLSPAEEALFAAHPDLVRRLTARDSPPPAAAEGSGEAEGQLAAHWAGAVGEGEGCVTGEAVGQELDRSMAQVAPAPRTPPPAPRTPHPAPRTARPCSIRQTRQGVAGREPGSFPGGSSRAGAWRGDVAGQGTPARPC